MDTPTPLLLQQQTLDDYLKPYLVANNIDSSRVKLQSLQLAFRDIANAQLGTQASRVSGHPLSPKKPSRGNRGMKACYPQHIAQDAWRQIRPRMNDFIGPEGVVQAKNGYQHISKNWESFEDIFQRLKQAITIFTIERVAERDEARRLQKVYLDECNTLQRKYKATLDHLETEKATNDILRDKIAQLEISLKEAKDESLFWQQKVERSFDSEKGIHLKSDGEF